MMRIALCDDDTRFMAGLRQSVQAWFDKYDEADIGKVLVEEFASSERLAACLKKEAFDILLLDIEMPKLDGMALAKTVREQLPWAVIIFLTSHDEFAPDGYRVQALRYLSKRTIDTQLDEALHAAMKVYNNLEVGTLDVTSYGNINRIAYRDIIYIRHQMRCSLISTVSQGLVKDARGIKELYSAIGNERFIFIDRGTFINVDHLQRIEDGKVVLRNGEILSISRRMLHQVKLTVNQILGG